MLNKNYVNFSNFILIGTNHLQPPIFGFAPKLIVKRLGNLGNFCYFFVALFYDDYTNILGAGMVFTELRSKKIFQPIRSDD